MTGGTGNQVRGPDFFLAPQQPPPALPAAPVRPPAEQSTDEQPPTRRAMLSGTAAVVVSLLAGAVAGGASGFAAGRWSSGSEVAAPPVNLPASPGGTPPPGGRQGQAGTVAGAAAAVLPSVVSVEASGFRGSATGSGFAIDARGHVITNAHVVDGANDVNLVLSNGRRVSASIVGTDEGNDIAVLRTSAGSVPAAALGRSSALRVGDTVLAVGSPLGLEGTVTAGIVSTVSRQAQLGESGQRQSVVQTDAAINPGNSGGPLVNAAGEVVGVNTAIATLGRRSEGAGNIGIGFAIPIDRARQIAEDLIDE
jgi:putative serine protease PepD